MEMWADKHRPSSAGGIIGQKKAVDETLSLLSSWKKGKGILFHGPPGTGKTLLAEAIAKKRGWFLLSLNASDSRSGKSVDEILTETVKNHSLFHKGKMILIDEVDGISGSERGGIQSLLRILSSSSFPVIFVANDAYLPKLRPLRQKCALVKFSKINYLSMASFLSDVCKKEGIDVDDDVVKNLSRWSQGDMRSALTDLQNICHGRDSITMKDMESLGFRERSSSIFSILPSIFRSGNARAARKIMRECDKDPDEILWWVETNLPSEFTDPASLERAYETLSRADVFRNRVMIQQNWRFKAIMSDLTACISLAGDSDGGFVKYRMPDRIIMMGRSKARRQERRRLAEKIASHTHSSSAKAMGTIPYIRMMLSGKGSGKPGLELTEEEAESMKP